MQTTHTDTRSSRHALYTSLAGSRRNDSRFDIDKYAMRETIKTMGAVKIIPRLSHTAVAR